MALTLLAAAVVIIRRCTSEMRPMRKQDDDIDLAAVAERLDGSAAGIAGGGDHDGAALAAHGERMVHQPRQKLHRQILERERRAVKQFEHEGVHAELGERGDCGMAKTAVGFARHACEVGFRDGIADERADHRDRDLGIGATGKGGDRLGLQTRPGLRHIKTAVAGKAREHGFGEAGRRGLAPGGDIVQFEFLTAGSATGFVLSY